MTTSLNNLATEKQHKMFFALCSNLGLNVEYMKERAKVRFSVESFNDLTVPQISQLIEMLMEKQKKMVNSHIFNCPSCGIQLTVKKI